MKHYLQGPGGAPPDAALDYSGVKPEKKEEKPDAAKETK
jgi:hypothetical protein